MGIGLSSKNRYYGSFSSVSKPGGTRGSQEAREAREARETKSPWSPRRGARRSQEEFLIFFYESIWQFLIGFEVGIMSGIIAINSMSLVSFDCVVLGLSFFGRF